MMKIKPLNIVYWPIYLTIFLAAWTAYVQPTSTYGDDWAIYPALMVFPLVIILHVIILFLNRWNIKFIFYAVVHIALLFVPWIYCLMLISKDSL